MITVIRKIIFLFITAGCFYASLTAQTKIQVVSRSITRTFTYSAVKIIQVNGEKAQIKVRPSLNKQVTLTLTLIAKNPSLQDAETDVKYCNYNINESADKIIITNNFDIKKGFKEISSNLGARIELEIPGPLPLIIRNIYGTIEIKDVQVGLNITNDFGQLSLSNISGNELVINSKYGDISGSVINTPLIIKSRNTDIILKVLNKISDISDQYGSIQLEKNKSSLNINGEMTAITISDVDFNNWSFIVKATKGQIDVPKEYLKYLSTKSGDANFIKAPGNTSLQIKNSYNKITLK